MSLVDDESSATKADSSQTETVKVSPYFLSSFDNPGAMISSVYLRGDDYNAWATKMVNALQAKCKTGFIDGSIPKPQSTDPNFENWKTVNSMIVGWI
ncbi:putative retrotransposon Copia-like protein [Arabidopsis thaliana]